jgi:AraC family transcriptional regulator
MPSSPCCHTSGHLPALAPGEFMTSTVEHRHGQGFVATEVVYRVAARQRTHEHEAANVALLVRGAYEEVVAGRTIAYSRRRAVYHPAGLRHRDHIGAPGTCFLVVELTGLLTPEEVQLLPREPFIDLSGQLAAVVTRLYAEGVQQDAISRLISQGLALELFGSFALRGRQREGATPIAAAADALLRERPEHSWSVEELAAAVGVSTYRLARAVRRTFGETLGARLRRARLERARELLAKPGTDLAEIAFACGFADQSHMTRLFRRAYGATPGAFRTARRHVRTR